MTWATATSLNMMTTVALGACFQSRRYISAHKQEFPVQHCNEAAAIGLVRQQRDMQHLLVLGCWEAEAKC